MEEVAGTGGVHCYPGSLSSFNHFFITDRTSGLYDGAHTCVEQNLQPVGKGEEGVGGGNSTVSTFLLAGKGVGTLNGCLLYTSPSPRDRG